MQYFVPLLLLFPQTIVFYKKIFNVIFLFGIVYFLFDIVFIRQLLSSDRSSLTSQAIVELSFDLSFPCSFILLTYSYHSKKRVLLASLAVLITLLCAIIRARRGLIIMTSTIVLLSYILFLFTSGYKYLKVCSVFLLTISLLVFVVHQYQPDRNGIFGFVMERGQEDTRSEVETMFYLDMDTKDWLIGKGIKGEYYCPDIEEDQVTNFRSVIETGYLQVILKGGIISLALLLLITVPAIIKGLFYSRNRLSKAAAIWIFSALISLYPTIVVSFSLRYVLVWICIGICYSKSIRELSETDMRKYFLEN